MGDLPDYGEELARTSRTGVEVEGPDNICTKKYCFVCFNDCLSIVAICKNVKTKLPANKERSQSGPGLSVIGSE